MAKERTRGQKISRRAFIISGAVIGGGFALGLGGVAFSNYKKKQFSGMGFEGTESLNAFIHITPDNKIKLAIARAEMGQGVHTALAMLTAEELEVDLEQIEVIHPQVESPYANVNLATHYERTSSSTGFHFMEKVAYILPYIATGGSTTIRDGYEHYRIMGASAKEMLMKVAMKKWFVDIDKLKAEKGFIVNTETGEKVSYGSLAPFAAEEKPNNRPTLKAKSNFKIIGKPTQRIDLKEKVTGAAEFGIDVRLPNMLFAAVKHCPIIGGEITSITNESEVMDMRGVKHIVQWPKGVAVIADNTWRAQQAANALTFEIDNKGNEQLSSAHISKLLKTRLNKEIDHVKEKIDNTATAFKAANKVFEAEYEVPFLAHATMEPINCTVLVEEDKAKVWVGHQAPFLVTMATAKEADINSSKVEIDIKYLGGGFGRRAENDFVTEAVRIAKAMKGTPIQMVWSREEDTQFDTYRPAAMASFKAGINNDGRISAWKNHLSLQSVLRSSIGRNFPLMTPPESQDTTAAEGALGLAYNLGARKVGYSFIESPMRLGFWRSVGHSYNGFFTESFIDELANEADTDPYEFRAKLLPSNSRQKKVLDKVAEISNWNSPLPEGKSRGIAFHESFGSIVAQVAEISINPDKEFSVDKVFCVIDCGNYVNPDTIIAQMQSGIVFGLTAAVYGEITIEEGKIQQSNFPNYEMLKLKHMPEVFTHIMENNEAPGGVGEPGTPPIAPALTNAIFAATGERVRSLPLKNHGFKLV